ncbi:MAG: hypothetical protein WCP33_06105 [Deltaproteobacteria bacterium]
MVVPVGSESEQMLLKIVKNEDGSIETTSSTGCRFVPLLGRQGWQIDRF